MTAHGQCRQSFFGCGKARLCGWRWNNPPLRTVAGPSPDTDDRRKRIVRPNSSAGVRSAARLRWSSHGFGTRRPPGLSTSMILQTSTRPRWGIGVSYRDHGSRDSTADPSPQSPGMLRRNGHGYCGRAMLQLEAPRFIPSFPTEGRRLPIAIGHAPGGSVRKNRVVQPPVADGREAGQTCRRYRDPLPALI